MNAINRKTFVGPVLPDDGAGVNGPMAFALAGWFNDWSSINVLNGVEIPAAVPCSTQYQGKLLWHIGPYITNDV
jgi:hypothetical protein